MKMFNENLFLTSLVSQFPLETYRIYPIKGGIDFSEFFDQCEMNLVQTLFKCLTEYINIKFNLKVYVSYTREDEEGNLLLMEKHFEAPYVVTNCIKSAFKELSEAVTSLNTMGTEFMSKDSGWSIHTLEYFEINVIKLDELPTQTAMEDKKAEFSYPNPNTKMAFQSFHKNISPPIVIYAGIKVLEGNYPDTSMSENKDVQSPTACAASFYIIHHYNYDMNEMFTFEGPDCLKMFCRKLNEETKRLYNQYWKTEKMPEIMFGKNHIPNLKCFACDKSLTSEEWEVSFNQFNGKPIGPVHSACKLEYKLTDPSFPVIFENFSTHTMNLLVSELGEDMELLPGDMELYSTITKRVIDSTNSYKICFLNKNKFFNFNLEYMGSYMDVHDFQHLKDKFPGNKLDMMFKKFVFPNGYIDNVEKLKETKLPDINQFFNTHDGDKDNIEDYYFAQKVWTTFGCTNILEYMKLYLERDVIILADVFENFRKTCNKIYSLEPVHYPNAESMSWDAMLKCTKVQLDLISDPEMVKFISSARREGLIQCTTRMMEANNRYMQNFNPRKPTRYLACLEANNLNEWAMSQPLPCSDFKFLSSYEIKSLDFRNICPDGEIGYLLEVDLRYPHHLHDPHNFLPFCPINRIPPGKKIPIVMADLDDKKNYILNLKHLQLCLQQGLILENIHRVLSFQQCCWLKPYIDLNLNQSTKNEYETRFFESMNYAIYRKSMKKPEEDTEIFLFKEKEFLKRIAKNNVQSVEIFGQNLAAIKSKSSIICYNEPIYIGVVVSELTKWKMYDYYYNFLLVKCPSLVKGYMDNNLFIVSMEEDIYSLIKDNHDHFDTSNFEDNRFNIIPKNRNKLGLLKDKSAGRIMAAFAGLKTRVYTCIQEEEDNN